MTGLLVLTRYGFIKINDPIVRFFVDFDALANIINSESYIVSLWLFRNITRIFKKSYVITVPNGITTLKHLERVIDKVEEVEGEKIPEERRDQIEAQAVTFLDL